MPLVGGKGFAGSPPRHPLAKPPPVSKSTQYHGIPGSEDTVFQKAVAHAGRKALAKAKAARKKNRSLAQLGGSPVLDSTALIQSMAPQPPVFAPIIDPTKQVMRGVGKDVAAARQSTARQFAEAQKALGNIEGDPSVAGANASDVYMGGLGGISGTQRAIEGEIGPEFAQFVLKQMQDRVQQQAQYEADLARYQQGLMASPSQIAQLASKGLLGKVPLDDPYAVAAALQSAGRAREISDDLKLDLEELGIDWRKYQFDSLGAKRIVRQHKKTGGISDEALKEAILNLSRG